MPNGQTATVTFEGFPDLDDVMLTLIDNNGNVLLGPTPQGVHNVGNDDYMVSPAAPPGYQFGAVTLTSATALAAGVSGRTVPYNLSEPVPYPSLLPASTVGLPQYVSDANGRLTIPNWTGVLTSAITLTDGGGTTIGPVAMTPITATDPQAALLPPGDPSYPGQVVGYYVDGLPAGTYTAYSDATGGVQIGVIAAPAFSTPVLTLSFPDDLSGCPLNDGDPLRLPQGETAVCLLWLLPSGVNLTGAEATLLLVPRRRRSVVYGFDGAVQVSAGQAPALAAFFTTVWSSDDPPGPGPYWARVRCTLADATVLDTSPVLVMVLAAPAPTEP
jgi:hypothetical protein